jgi:hypothetical protein
MKPTSFKGQTTVIAKDQKQYQPLPALRIKGKRGVIICCWRMSWWERVYTLFTGRVWVSLLTFNQPVSPSYLFVQKQSGIKAITKTEAAYDKGGETFEFEIPFGVDLGDGVMFAKDAKVFYKGKQIGRTK